MFLITHIVALNIVFDSTWQECLCENELSRNKVILSYITENVIYLVWVTEKSWKE